MTTGVNVDELRTRVQDLYREVAENPASEFHFELGRVVAERLGYDPKLLDRVPRLAVDSFAGVGCPFAVAELSTGEKVLDLGSGSGMDSCYAALVVGPTGEVTGVDMTEAQLDNSRRAAAEARLANLRFSKAFIEAVPLPDRSVDLVISNGVINLVAEKARVFEEIARVLRPGGRVAIADIVSERQLSDNIVSNAALWASCIGGASLEAAYLETITSSGLEVTRLADNVGYSFLSMSAKSACADFGVKSIILRAEKPH